MQRNRALVYAVGGLLAVVGRAMGALQVGYLELLGLIGMAVSSAGVFYLVYARGLDDRLPVRPEPIWMTFDVVLITLGVGVSGGVDSPWFVWYLANLAAAAFVADWKGVILVSLGNIGGYLGLLTWMGQIDWSSTSLHRPLLGVVFLHAGTLFFVAGVIDLKAKRLVIKRLQREQSLKLEELMRLTRALAEANTKVREADHMKSQFLANMSHELRTPLNSILGFSEILQGAAGDNPDKRERFLGNIHRSGEHLLAIINDILDLSKIEAGRMELHPQPVRTDEIVAGVVGIMRGMAAKRRSEIEVDVPADLPTLETDAGRLKQVLYNLLSNAVKFSPDGATVTVTARAVGAGDSPLGVDSMALAVSDHGVGIAPEDQEVIFNEFRQASPQRDEAAGGTGLGLALVRRFVELQGGAVGVESAPGEGSTFTVTLPLEANAADTAAGGPEVELLRERSGYNPVLVVEDDLAAYQTLSHTLTEAGYTPVRARHGDEALELARTVRPKVITLDLGLPGDSGWEVLRQLKELPETRDTPVVIISLMENEELGLALGADDYFTKPVDRGRLVERLAEMAAPQRRARILVIDDDPEVHELVDESLGPLGYTVEHAADGEEGLRLALEGPPAAVILDLVMPGLSGFEVAARLAADEATAHVPIVVLTAKELTEEELESLRGRVSTLVPKGGAMRPLLAAIEELDSRSSGEWRRGARAAG